MQPNNDNEPIFASFSHATMDTTPQASENQDNIVRHSIFSQRPLTQAYTGQEF